MGAPKGNQFWKNRTKHGRDKLFESPEILWEEAATYFDWCDEHPLMSTEIYGKDAIECKVPKMRAYTWSGLEVYLNVSDLKNYRTQPQYKDFFPVLTRIEQIIFTQKFEGAAAGFLNANIIARDLQLRDNQDITTGGAKLPGMNVTALPTEDLKQLEQLLAKANAA